MAEEITPCSEVRIPMPWGHLAGRWYGDQIRRPILALHGWLDNCGTFITLAPLITPHCSLLCIDLPGHGHSSHFPIGTVYNKHYYVMLILRIMETYKWKKVSLLGHSMGGSVAFDFACYHPSRVDLVISIDILNTSFVQRLDLHPNYIHHVMERAIIENDRLVHASPMSEPPSYSFEECEYLLFEATNQSVHLDKCKYLLERNISPSPKYPAKYYFSRDNRVKTIYNTSVNNDLLREMTARICHAELPYIVIKAGESDEINENTQKLVDMLRKHDKNFEFHELPGERHHLHLNNPEPVAKLIISFLQNHPQETNETKPAETSKL